MVLQRVGLNWATFTFTVYFWTYPGGSDSEEIACNVEDLGLKKKKEEDLGLIPGLGKSPEEGNGNPLQYACLENPMDRGP